MAKLICIACDEPLRHPEPHGFCARCAELAEALFDAEREMRAAATLLPVVTCRAPTIH